MCYMGLAAEQLQPLEPQPNETGNNQYNSGDNVLWDKQDIFQRRFDANTQKREADQGQTGEPSVATTPDEQPSNEPIPFPADRAPTPSAEAPPKIDVVAVQQELMTLLNGQTLEDFIKQNTLTRPDLVDKAQELQAQLEAETNKPYELSEASMAAIVAEATEQANALGGNQENITITAETLTDNPAIITDYLREPGSNKMTLKTVDQNGNSQDVDLLQISVIVLFVMADLASRGGISRAASDLKTFVQSENGNWLMRSFDFPDNIIAQINEIGSGYSTDKLKILDPKDLKELMDRMTQDELFIFLRNIDKTDRKTLFSGQKYIGKWNIAHEWDYERRTELYNKLSDSQRKALDFEEPRMFAPIAQAD